MPRLIFLHGFLGSKEDWKELISLFPSYECTALDLVHPIDALAQQISTPAILIGYSLGGRLSLQIADHYPHVVKGVIALSAHPGLTHPLEREQRFQSDLIWAEKLSSLPFSTFLEEWYNQPLFDPFKRNTSLFENTLSRRLNQKSEHLREMLLAYSLGKLPPFSFSTSHPLLFLHGDKDIKYQSLYSQFPPHVKVKQISNAGHALHLEQPHAVAQQIHHFLESIDANT
jgi:2-succinyl-6-hydroxy-2,4-cyclohexadiene-1-carboxylate synthase